MGIPAGIGTGIDIVCAESIPCIAGMGAVRGAGRRRVESDVLPLMPGMSAMPGIGAAFFGGGGFCCAASDWLAMHESAMSPQ